MNGRIFKIGVLLIRVFLGLQLSAQAQSQDSLAEYFRYPPDVTRPWCYWYWISDNISKEGITKDLELFVRRWRS